MWSPRIATLPAFSDRPNEDYAEAKGNVVVLLDGAGIPKHLPTGCQHSVHWFVHQLGPALLDHAAGPIGLDQALRKSITDIRALHADTCDLDHPYSPAATVIMVRVSDQVEALVLTDSTLVVSRSDGELSVITDDRLEILQDRLISERQTPEPGWMAPYVNQPGGFWTASTNPASADEAIIRIWPTDQVTSFVLLSDGAARLVDMFQRQTWPEVLKTIADHGADEVLDQVRSMELTDPDHQRWPRTKTHDDATIAVVDLG